MSTPSPVSQSLHDSFDEQFLPLLRQLGFAPAKPKNVKPGLVVALAMRDIDAGRRLEATLWCDGGTGDHLRFRLDLVEPNQGVECWRQVELEVPWPDPSAPKPRSLDFSGSEFRPHESTDQLRTAIAFLAGGFAANGQQVASAVPELADEIRTAQRTAPWCAAAERAAELWKRRHVRGDVDEAVVPATVVFVGGQLLSVDVEGARLTFRFDTRFFDRDSSVSLSGWYRTPAGTRIATKLINGARSWTFGYDGKLISATP